LRLAGGPAGLLSAQVDLRFLGRNHHAPTTPE
jgi:hypothetical protein